MANTVDKVIAIAEAEVGYLEKKTNAYLDDKTKNAGYNNYTKYGRDMHNIYPAVMDFPAAWCDCFVDWCFYKAYGISTAKALLGGNFDDYTVNSANMYKKKGSWFTNNPKIGDQIFFKNSSRICHTGLVYAVDSKYVYTIEGNTSAGNNTVVANGGGVFKKKYLLNNSRIAGYGRPNYDSIGFVNPTPAETANKNIYVATGLVHAKNFTGIDWGTDEKKAKAGVLQTAMNFDYRSGLTVDGVFGTKSKAALGSHYVALGETQYMVTALEVLLYLNGIDPNGIELPGLYDKDLTAAVKQKFGGTGNKVSATNFLQLL